MASSGQKQEGGLRPKGSFKKTLTTDKPVVSIITVVYNNRQEFNATFQSVKEQTYTNIEYVVIDGGSDDGTLEEIQQKEGDIAYWVSEPDEGIYDAMNKGLDVATGDFVWFMNAGDLINGSKILESIYELDGLQSDIYYGETNLVNEQGEVLGTRSELTTRKLPAQLTVNSMGGGMVVCHQSFIARRKNASHYMLEYPCSADIEWVIRCLKNSDKVVNTGMILSRFLVGGFSGQNRQQCLKERFYIFRQHFGMIKTLYYHILILFRAFYYTLRGENQY